MITGWRNITDYLLPVHEGFNRGFKRTISFLTLISLFT